MSLENLPSSTSLGNLDRGHGFRPTGYVVEFASDPDPASYGNPWGPWEVRDAALQTLDLSYGTKPDTVVLTMADPATTRTPGASAGERETYLQVPRVGDLVRIWQLVDEGDGPEEPVLRFKGAIGQVNRRRDRDAGWVLSARSEVSRLNDTRVTLKANLTADPLRPAPHFDAQGFLVRPGRFTLYELVRSVMNYPNAFGRAEYFDFEQIDWNGLAEDPRCGGFVPADVQFSETPRGQAVEALLAAAGNYKLHYVPGEDRGDDRLVVVELNLRCNRCGPQWPVRFPDPGGRSLAHEVDVAADRVSLSVAETANVARVTGGPLRLYSGHKHIAEVLDPTPAEPDADTRHLVPRQNDTAAEQRARSVNLDGVNYRFNGPGELIDRRATKQTVVGMPLFPDWNVHADYLPRLIHLESVKFAGDEPPTNAAGTALAEEDFTGLCEFDTRTLGDHLAAGAVVANRTDHLRAWQAWWTGGPCPACGGSGLVERVYSGPDNEPQFTFFAEKPDGTRRELGSVRDELLDGERLSARVNNYLFDPDRFGRVDPDTGEPYPPTGLSPLDLEAAGDYPLPWKNLCPYCRGVGQKPAAKMRNLAGTLFEGRHSTERDPDDPAITRLDPELTQTGPETWQQSQDRFLLSQPPTVQYEAPVLVPLPLDWSRRNQPGYDVDPPRDAAHPLAYQNLRGILARRHHNDAELAADLSLGRLDEDDWSCRVPYTKVETTPAGHALDARLGRVLFDEPLFVPCRKPFAAYRAWGEKETYQVGGGGTLVRAAKVQVTEGLGGWNGYWRPPRVWMSGFTEAAGLYQSFLVDSGGEPVEAVGFAATNEEGETEQYLARAMIVDGRWSVEVIKPQPDYDPAGNAAEFVTGHRPIYVSEDRVDEPVEIYRDDLVDRPVPAEADLDYRGLEALKAASGDRYPAAKLSRFEEETRAEQVADTDGFSDDDRRELVLRPKVYQWALRDGRSRLMGLAVRLLERTNNLTVGGHLDLQLHPPRHLTGLGWIDYPDAGPVAVVRVVYDFARGYGVTAELSRERPRLGEPAEEELDRVARITRRLEAIADGESRTARPVIGRERRQARDTRIGGGPDVIVRTR